MAVKLNYTFAADAIAAKGGVPPSLVSALVNAESAWNPSAVSSTGATGLGQFTQGTAKDYGLMGDGFDNRADAALNLTAMVKYLGDLKNNNPTWREVIRRYSGQTSALEGYARYSAGQLLIMVVDALDGTGAAVPADGDAGPTIVIDSILGHDQSSGRPAKFISPMVALGMLALAGSPVLVACCSPQTPPLHQQAALPLPAVPEGERKPAPASIFDGSTFVLVGGPRGLLAVPLGK